MMKAVVFTLGCKVNECESDSLIAGLSEMGYEVSDKLEKADVYIVNTCAVTSEAEKKSRQTASRIRKLNPNAKIIYVGCASQKNPEAFADKGENVLVAGTFSKNKILSMLKDSGIRVSPYTTDFEELFAVKSLRERTYVKVQDGCNNFCSYCIVPYLRGRSRSRSPENVYEELVSVKPVEAVLNGINLSAYDCDGVNLAGLIRRIKDVNCRIRLGSLEANVITEEFLTALKGLRDFADHFHLSLQSGSDDVLKSMNRRYTCEEYARKVELIRSYFPDAGITTDVIAGFPTETEDDFDKTLTFIDRIGFSDIHPFIYSPREGTVAYKMKDLPYDEKKRRLDLLLEKKQNRKDEFVKKQEGKILSFLPEVVKDGYAEGYTGNYLRVYVKDCPCDNRITKVKIIGRFKDGAEGVPETR